MSEKTKQAIEMYRQAYRAEQEGRVNLAEVYYLKSRAAFEEVGGAQYLSAANVLNALTFLRWSRKDYEGALRSAQESVQIMENQGAQFSSLDADFIHSTSCELMDQMQYEMSLVSVR
jgi:Tetratricopeptide repeat